MCMNHLLADDSHVISCLICYFWKLRKMIPNLSSAAVMIGTLRVNSSLASSHFCHLLITFANSLDQVRTNKKLVLIWILVVDTLKVFLIQFFEKVYFEKISRQQQKHEKLPSRYQISRDGIWKWIQTVLTLWWYFWKKKSADNKKYAKLLHAFWERECFAGFGHVERSSGAIRTVCDIQIDGRRGAGRPKLTWKKLSQRDCHEWKLTTVDPQERST